MKNMRVIFWCMCLFMTSGLWAQTDEVPAVITWGEDLREPSNTYVAKLVSYGSWGFYALRKKEESNFSKEEAYLELYDSEMRLRKSKELDLKYKGKRRLFEDLLLIGGELYLLTSFNNRAKNKNYLFAQKINRKRFLPEKSLTLLGEIDSRSEYRAGEFDIEISKDSSKVMIYNQLPYKKREPERFTFRVYDNQLNPIWEKDIILPYNDEKYKVQEYRVDNEGNIYLLGTIFEEQYRRSRNGRPNYEYNILAYTDDGRDFQEYKVSLGDKFISDLTFRIDTNGDLVCSGFYSERSIEGVKGTYFFRMNPKTGDVKQINSMEFDFAFRSALLSNSRRRRAARAEQADDKDREPELSRYSLDDLILRTDGGALLIAEQYFVERYYTQTFWNQPSQVRFHYNYNDIIVVNIRPNGEIEWATRIPKFQETIDDRGYYSSYAKAIVRDRIYFMYNDNNRNFDRNNSKLYSFNGRNSVIAITELRKDGTISTYPLFRNRDAGIITRPKICKQIGLRKMAVYGEWGRGYRFGTLEFE